MMTLPQHGNSVDPQLLLCSQILLRGNDIMDHSGGRGGGKQWRPLRLRGPFLK